MKNTGIIQDSCIFTRKMHLFLYLHQKKIQDNTGVVKIQDMLYFLYFSCISPVFLRNSCILKEISCIFLYYFFSCILNLYFCMHLHHLNTGFLYFPVFSCIFLYFPVFSCIFQCTKYRKYRKYRRQKNTGNTGNSCIKYRYR